jgi:hypothetical protein
LRSSSISSAIGPRLANGLLARILNGARERAYACLGDDEDAGSSSSDDDESSVEESQDLLR